MKLKLNYCNPLRAVGVNSQQFPVSTPNAYEMQEDARFHLELFAHEPIQQQNVK
jgi:hypothetical protein